MLVGHFLFQESRNTVIGSSRIFLLNSFILLCHATSITLPFQPLFFHSLFFSNPPPPLSFILSFPPSSLFSPTPYFAFAPSPPSNLESRSRIRKIEIRILNRSRVVPLLTGRYHCPVNLVTMSTHHEFYDNNLFIWSIFSHLRIPLFTLPHIRRNRSDDVSIFSW